MEEKMEELYNEYLKEKLDLIFNSGTGETFNTKTCESHYIYDEYNQCFIDEFGNKIDIKTYLDENYPDLTYCGADKVSDKGYSIYNTKEQAIMELYDIDNSEYHVIKPLTPITGYRYHPKGGFNEGYAIVEKERKFNFIDKERKILSEEWYDHVRDFHEGYARVEKKDKCNFINTEGKILSKEWYDGASDFHEGYAVVYKGCLRNYIDKYGNLLSEEWYDHVSDFYEGYAIVKIGDIGDKCNFINTEGKISSKEWYDSANDFHEGYALVEKEGKYNFIDKKFKTLSEEWYDGARDFHEGYARIRKKVNYNFIDKEGKILSEEWYDSANDFHEGYALVKKEGKYNFIDKRFKTLSEEWYDHASDFYEGYALVLKGNKYNYINTEGKLLWNTWRDDYYEFLVNFHNGYALVSKSNKDYSLIDKSGNFVIDNVDSIYRFEDGNFAYKKSGKLYYLDSNFKHINFYPDEYHSISDFDIDIKDYKVKKGLFGYILYNSYDKFKVKYEPIKNYGLRYVLCLNKGKLYLYDRKLDKYENIEKGKEISYDDNFIWYDDKLYFFYDDKKIDITDYYKKYLIGKKEINITKDIDILMKLDFDNLNRDLKIKFLNEEKEKNKKLLEQQTKLKYEQDILKAKKDLELENKKIEQEEIETLKMLKESINKLNNLRDSKDNKSIKRTHVDNILVDVDDHKEIMDELKNILKFIDLSTISFKNVDVRGIDFRDSNIDLYPQEVYNKDLSNSDFTGVSLNPFINFNGVDIRGSKFSIDNDPKTLDVMPKFEKAIYDETTTYNGKSLVDLIGPCEELNNRKNK